MVSGLRVIVWGHYKPFDVYHFRRGLFTTDLCGPHQGRPLSGIPVSEHRDKKEDDRPYSNYSCCSPNRTATE